MNEMQTAPGRTEVMRPGPEHSALERVLIGGDLAALNPDQRVSYYKAVCESLGVNMLTRPFDYLELDDGKGKTKLVLYGNKGLAEQLRKLSDVTVVALDRAIEDEICIVKVRVRLPNGREDEAMAAVPLYEDEKIWKKTSSGKQYPELTGKRKAMSGLAKSNAMMKAETKAKRRATLSICGLGLLDESDVQVMIDETTSTNEPPATVPEKRLIGMEEDPDFITLDHWNHLKFALVASGGTQAELLAHAGVERPGQIRREKFDDLLKLARTPRKEWPALPRGGAGPEKPKNGAPAPQKPGNGGTPTQPKPEAPLTSTSPPLPVTMQQLDELRKQINRVGASDMEVYAFLQTHGCSKLDELDEDMAEWILAELREQQDAREPGIDKE